MNGSMGQLPSATVETRKKCEQLYTISSADLDRLVIKEVPEPQPQLGHVIIEVKADEEAD